MRDRERERKREKKEKKEKRGEEQVLIISTNSKIETTTS